MSYSKAEIRELARAQLSRLTRKSLGKIELDMICTIALDVYARETYAFEQESLFDTEEDVSTYDLPTGFIAPSHDRSIRVGTGDLAKGKILSEEAFEDLQDQSPGSSRKFWMIDDAAAKMECYPIPVAVEAVRFRNFYVPTLPTADATDYPEPLELRGFMQCIRVALWDFEGVPERAEVALDIFRKDYLLDIRKRIKERRKPSVNATRHRSTG